MMTNLVYKLAKQYSSLLLPCCFLGHGTHLKRETVCFRCFLSLLLQAHNGQRNWSEIGRRAEARESLHVHPLLFGSLLLKLKWQALLSLFGNTTTTKAGNPFSTHSWNSDNLRDKIYVFSCRHFLRTIFKKITENPTFTVHWHGVHLTFSEQPLSQTRAIIDTFEVNLHFLILKAS